ncbi:MAG: UvrD-helicase domain-containing protein [Candidatus Melainabacteria bacterium]|nr:UvrD-helicase domain-containing protein [Candidatus Melainabacteria bacterium]
MSKPNYMPLKHLSNKLLSNDNITSGLNENQLSAVTYGSGPLLIVAGAGSGKTRVLTHRIAYLISSGFMPESILAVTFTNKAASEMKERLYQLLSKDIADLVWIGTFHNVCGRILRHDISKLLLSNGERWTSNFVIYDESDSTSLIKESILALDLDGKVYVPKSIRGFISSLKSQGYDAKSFGDIAKNHREVKISEVFDLYQKELAKNNGLDFDDLLLYSVKLLEQNEKTRNYYHKRFQHVLVDEFQDTNLIQYELIRLISEGLTKEERKNTDRSILWKERGITTVGDVDQSIYSWRGADFRIILGFQNDFPENTLIKLEKNYRSTETILNTADSIIKNNTERIEKTLLPTKSKGEKIICFEADDEIEEAQYVAKETLRLLKSDFKYSDIGVLYRTNAQSRAIEEALIKRNIPYQIVGGFRFYERKEIKDIISYLKVIYNPSDSVSLKRIINVPKRGLGATTLIKIEEYANKNNFTLYKTLLEIKDVPDLSERTIVSVQNFVELMEYLRKASKSLSISDLLDQILKKSGYWDELEKEGTLDSEERLANIQELYSVANEFEASSVVKAIHELPQQETFLGDFLTQISLYTELDNLKQTTNKITLTTLHLAKGLEYPIVFICGLEEGVFPHLRSIDSLDKNELEEERRLMYVGVTRAKEKLYFTYARERRLFGSSEYSQVSRFIEEAPKELLSGFYGGLDEKIKNNKSHIPKKNIQRKYSEYEIDELIIPDNVQKVTKLRDPRAHITQHSESSTQSFFDIGDKVQHEKFGVGIIEQIFGQGEKNLVNVDFEKYGKKLLDPRYAKLIKL